MKTSLTQRVCFIILQTSKLAEYEVFPFTWCVAMRKYDKGIENSDIGLFAPGKLRNDMLLTWTSIQLIDLTAFPKKARVGPIVTLFSHIAIELKLVIWVPKKGRYRGYL